MALDKSIRLLLPRAHVFPVSPVFLAFPQSHFTAVQLVGEVQGLGCGFTGPRRDETYNALRAACRAGFGPGPIGNIAAVGTMSRTLDLKGSGETGRRDDRAPAARA